jgi:hypothetical protein
MLCGRVRRVTHGGRPANRSLSGFSARYGWPASAAQRPDTTALTGRYMFCVPSNGRPWVREWARIAVRRSLLSIRPTPRSPLHRTAPQLTGMCPDTVGRKPFKSFATPGWRISFRSYVQQYEKSGRNRSSERYGLRQYRNSLTKSIK